MKIFKQLFEKQNITPGPCCSERPRFLWMSERTVALQTVAMILAFVKAGRTGHDLEDGLPFRVAQLPLNPF